MRIYTLRDKNIDQVTRVDVFVNDLVAFREYDLQLLRFKQENPFIKIEDYEVVHLADITADLQVVHVGHVITKEYIIEKLKDLPAFQKVEDITKL